MSEITTTKELLPIVQGGFVFSENEQGVILREKLKEIKKAGEQILVETKKLVVLEDEKYVIIDEKSNKTAGVFLKDAYEYEKDIEKIYKSIEKALTSIKKKVTEIKKIDSQAVTEIKKILNQGMGEFRAKIEKETAEKARLERERIEAERLAEAERKQKEAEALKETGNPDDMAAALNLETEAEDILDAPPPVVEVKQLEKISGIKQRRYIKCEIQDEYKLRTHILALIAQFVTGGKSLVNLLKVNDSAVRAYVKSLDASGKKLTEIQAMFPGLHVWVDNKATT